MIGLDNRMDEPKTTLDLAIQQTMKNGDDIIMTLKSITDVMNRLARLQKQFLQHLKDHDSGKL